MPKKPFWKSKALWGGSVAVLSLAAHMISKGGLPSPEDLLALAGAIVGIYGRIAATTTLVAKPDD